MLPLATEVNLAENAGKAATNQGSDVTLISVQDDQNDGGGSNGLMEGSLQSDLAIRNH